MAEEIKLWDKIQDTWSGNVDPEQEKYSIKEDLKSQEYPFRVKPKRDDQCPIFGKDTIISLPMRNISSINFFGSLTTCSD